MKTAKLLALGIALLLTAGTTLAQESVEKWGADLASGDKKARREAAYQLHQLGREARPALPALIKALDDGEQQVWFHSIMTIAAIGPDATQAIPRLMEGLQGRGRNAGDQGQYRSAYALGCIGSAALPPLREALGSDNVRQQTGAAKALGFIGSAAAPATPDLVALLKSDERELREIAVETLGLIGPAAVDPLSQMLSSDDREARACATQALGEIGPPAQAATELLANLARRDQAVLVRASAIEALRRIGYPELLSILLEALQTNNPDDQQAAINALLLLRPADQITVPGLIPLLQAKESGVRERTAYVLGRIGPPSAAAVPALIENIESNKSTHAPFVRALGEIGPAAAPTLLAKLGSVEWEHLTSHWSFMSLKGMGPRALGPLINALAEPNPALRYATLLLLTEQGPRAKSAQTAVLKLVQDPDTRVRAQAIHTAFALELALDSVRAQLVELLKDPAPEVRAAAALSMSRLSDLAPEAVPALLDLTDDANLEAAAIAIGALRQVTVNDPATAIERLLPKLDHKDATLRKEAITTLGHFKKDAQPAVAKLSEIAKEGDVDLRLAAVQALGNIGSMESRPTLEALLKAPEAEIRAMAASALGQAKDPALLPILIEALKDDASSVRQRAAESIGQLGPDGREATGPLFELLKNERDWQAALDSARAIQVTSVPHLIGILSSDETAVRSYACQRLGRLGPAAKEALPALQPLLKDRNDFIQRQARAAIRRIEQD